MPSDETCITSFFVTFSLLDMYVFLIANNNIKLIVSKYIIDKNIIYIRDTSKISTIEGNISSATWVVVTSEISTKALKQIKFPMLWQLV